MALSNPGALQGVAPAALDARDPLARLAGLFDAGAMRLLPGSESGPAGAGAIAAVGLVRGCRAIGFATDPRRSGGALGADGCRNIVEAIDTALRQRIAVVGLWHSGGARINEGVAALNGVGEVFAAMVRASGRVPQISVVLGPAAGGAAYGPALTDIVIMSGSARIFVTGPDVVRSATGEQIDMEGLGGPEAHGQRSGVAHVVTATDEDAVDAGRQAVELLTRSVAPAPASFEDVDLGALLPERKQRAYDVRKLVSRLLDEPGLELQPRWAPNVVIALGRLGGRTVGVVANNPLRLGGCLNTLAAEKASRFVRMCDSFGVPLVVIVDVPGYLPGVSQEWDGIVRRGSKLLHAFAGATVPRVTLVTRKAFGGAYIAMNCRALGATAVFAWPGAEIAVMGASSAVEILHRKQLEAAAPEERTALRDRLADEHAQKVGGVARAMELGVVDDVIEPNETRSRIAAVLESTVPTRGTHTNIPL
jgi:acetyl-CoA/propionyl-CoA carboxylase carboxyl transferase subunit